jgi:antitoxin (DNA-binding transcriptional repressor) of toxin-antitoxin stability system
MRTVSLKRAARSLASFAAGGDVVVLTDKSRPVAALISFARMDPESRALATHPDFRRLIAKARREVRAGRTVSLDAVKREFRLKPARVGTSRRRSVATTLDRERRGSSIRSGARPK